MVFVGGTDQKKGLDRSIGDEYTEHGDRLTEKEQEGAIFYLLGRYRGLGKEVSMALGSGDTSRLRVRLDTTRY